MQQFKITLYRDESHLALELEQKLEERGYTVQKISTASPNPTLLYEGMITTGYGKINALYLG